MGLWLLRIQNYLVYFWWCCSGLILFFCAYAMFCFGFHKVYWWFALCVRGDLCWDTSALKNAVCWISGRLSGFLVVQLFLVDANHICMHWKKVNKTGCLIHDEFAWGVLPGIIAPREDLPQSLGSSQLWLASHGQLPNLSRSARCWRWALAVCLKGSSRKVWLRSY